MHRKRIQEQLGGSTENGNGRSSGASQEEGETRQEVSRPPLLLTQSRPEAIPIPLPYWQRLERRVATMPEPSTIWLTAAGVLAGVSLERHDESALLTGAGSVACYLAHRMVAKANRGTRADIVDEMRVHGPVRARDGRRR
jgi:hypothetical protein